ELMEKSNIQDKELILRVLSMQADPEVREREIKNMANTYKVIADEILPQLRRSKMSVNVEVIGKSDEEISNLAANDPSQLNVEEEHTSELQSRENLVCRLLLEKKK